MAKRVTLSSLGTEIYKEIDKYTDEVYKASNEVVKNYGQKALKNAETRINLGPGVGGHLKQKLKVRNSNASKGGKSTVYATDKKDVLFYLEKGTTKMKSYPVLEPTLNVIAPRFKAALIAKIKSL